MAGRTHIHWVAATLSAAALAVPVAGRATGPVDVSFLYSCSSTTGFLPFNGASIAYDVRSKELFVRDTGLIRVFNDSGMEIFTFGDNPELGGLRDVAALDDGDMLGLSQFDGKPVLLRMNYRGELVERFAITGVPEAQAHFRPNALRYRDGRIYLADLGRMEILVADAQGRFDRFFDIAEMMGEAPKRQDLGLRGFNVDFQGNVLFTIQPLFHGYLMSLNGEIREFGVKGSGPGKFNVVSGIAADENGNLYVSDILKSAVIVFDKDFRFVKEFGGRTNRPGGLAAPVEVEAGNGKIFVSQYGRRGVSVFKVVQTPVG